AGESGCKVLAEAGMPDAFVLWPAIDGIHLAIVSIVASTVAQAVARENERLSRSTELTQSQTRDSMERLAETVGGKSVLGQVELHREDPLLSSCRIVAATLGASIPASSRSASEHPFRDILEIARTARLRVRKVLLREGWWKLDVGPLVAWRGEDPVALIRDRQGGYTMIDSAQGTRLAVTSSLAEELVGEAA